MKKKIVFLPYDFDTAIGINNEGSLVFSYNLEDIDQTSGGADIFNGQQSVLWKNLREMFGAELKAMYQSLRSTGAISYAKIEKAFEDHQEKWPAAVFNEDAWFKYLAPLEEKGSAAYLAMLQGSKAEQRKWWLYNRFKYIDSKYNAGDSLTDVITLRGYAKSNITITPYADVYATIKFGSYLVQTRATRNQSYTMVCPLDNVNDTEIYIYSASQLADVGDLSGLKVGYAEFVYGTKLQHLKLGDSSGSYTNGNLQTLYLGNNRLLKTLDVRNCIGLGTGDQKTVDLSGCTGIEEVYFAGTKITGVSLPNGGGLRVLQLPSTITSIVIRNQPSLTTFSCPSFSNVSTLWLENVGTTVDTKSIINALQSGARVRIFGFYWTFINASDVDTMLDKLDEMRGLDQNGDNVPTAQVYGTIHIPTATGAVIAHIQERYSDITVTYDHVSAVLTYRDDDGTLLGTETIVDGAAPANTPTMSNKVEGAYYCTFLGWGASAEGSVDSDILDGVVADTTVYAIYRKEISTFTVRLYNGSTLLRTYSNVTYGTTLSDLPTPTYTGPGDAEEYVFSGWSPAPENVTSDLDCYAQFTFTGLYFRKYLEGTLVSYTVPQDITSLPRLAFAGEELLTSVSLPSVTALPEACFFNCPALETIDCPSVLAVNKYSFTNTNALTVLRLSEMMLINAVPVVYSQSGLQEIRLPKNTSSYGNFMSSARSDSLILLDIGLATAITTSNLASSLTGYRALTYMIMRNTESVVTPASSSNVFYSSSPLGKGEGRILVPRSMVDAYKEHATWSNYAGEIFAIEDYPEICS